MGRGFFVGSALLLASALSLASAEQRNPFEGDEVAIRSRHGEIVGFVEGDGDMREGVVAMTHGFGPRPGFRNSSSVRPDG